MSLEYYIPEGDKYTGKLCIGTGSASESGSYNTLVFRSLEQLYYSNFTSGSIGWKPTNWTGSFDNYVESSFTTGSRLLESTASVYSIPQKLFGTHIEPNTFKIGIDDDYLINQDNYILIDYLEQSDIVMDDGEGVLRQGSVTGRKVGNIIYSHGQVIITDAPLATYYRNNPIQPISWKSNLPIYTYNYNVKISDYEYNFTLNPTAQSGSDGKIADNITGSYFQPYITTVGLYNDSNELIAVAKLAQPLPKSANTEMTIQVKLDI